ncbi:uncharacterized protein LOC129580230, partial [Sitodiplosis mosellana]|uniref:uncharacterized protein LOC129580230 n=1 Tax=Sitodiplosis mosellana TaxID=263140 RepID=UPI002443A481
MSKRENDGEITEKSKQQKLNDVNPRGTAAAAVDGQNEEPAPPAIFKLNAICCDDLFEWLSLKDLHSLGQTCKRMQRLTGVYFQENYKETRLFCENRNIYHNKIMMNEFFPYVQKIVVESNCLSDFKSINDGDSIRDISLDWFTMTESMIGCIKEKLNQIEVLHLRYLDMEIHLYEDFLQFCPNLKGLCVYYSHSKDNDDEWMNRKYPKLQHFRLQKRDDLISHNLRHFFQQNDQLQSFGTNDRFLLTNSDTFINSNLKLDVLNIRYSVGNLEHVCDLLNNLHEIGFY